MAIEYKNTKDWFNKGRGGPQSLAKSSEEIMHAEAEIMEDGMEAVPGDAGAKQIFATGEQPFHHGRGAGRGHGPETAKNA